MAEAAVIQVGLGLHDAVQIICLGLQTLATKFVAAGACIEGG